MKTLVTLFAGMLLSLGAWAMDLDQARDQGLVGERLDGYVGIVRDEDGVTPLVQSLNSKRKTHYQSIANKQNTPLANIEKIAGEKLVNKARSQGHFYQSASGDWQRDQ